MIKFFRKIRFNLMETGKTGKYLKYAIGEIVLVVIGILIALQINNWNQSRLDHKETKTLLKNLLLDVEEDIESLQILQNSLTNRKEWADIILKSLDGLTVSDSSIFIAAMTRVGWIMEYSITLPTYKEIVSSGKLSFIKSESLKKALANYQSQFEEHHQIVSSYHLGLKETEMMAIGHLIGMPETYSSMNSVESNSNVSFNLKDISEDVQFYKSVKHISHFSAVTIDYIGAQLITRAKQLKDMISDELKSYGL